MHHKRKPRPGAKRVDRQDRAAGPGRAPGAGSARGRAEAPSRGRSAGKPRNARFGRRDEHPAPGADLDRGETQRQRPRNPRGPREEHRERPERHGQAERGQRAERRERPARPEPRAHREQPAVRPYQDRERTPEYRGLKGRKGRKTGPVRPARAEAARQRDASPPAAEARETFRGPSISATEQRGVPLEMEGGKGRQWKKPTLELQTTTLWDYPSQHYGEEMQGDKEYVGATPSYVIWNLLERYTRKNDLVVDPMCGSGTTIDVARGLERRALGYDLAPFRPDIFRADARKLPLEDEKADFVFVDPPYSTHVDYSDDPRCIGKLNASDEAYYESMHLVIREIHRILRPRRYMGLFVSDSYKKGTPFMPIGFRLFALMERYFEAADIVAVVRHNRTLKRRHYHTEAVAGNYFLRGFNYLFIMKKVE